MLIFYIMISLIVLFPVLILLFDFFHRFIFMCCRYHIGRWNDNLNWEIAIEKICLKWLMKTPNVSPIDHGNYLLLDILRGKNKNLTIQSWQIAGLILGVSSLKSDKSGEYLSNWRKKYISEQGEWKINPQKIDSALLAYAMLRNYNKDEIKPAMDYVISIIEHNLCNDGMVSYSQGANSKIRFVDTLGMVCPFLALYGQVYNVPEYIELAYNQIVKFREFGMLKNTELPCHAINVENGLPLGVYGWGRGTGWYIFSLIETYKLLYDVEKKQELKKMILAACEQYYLYQNKDGGFETILQGGGQYDSTITILMAYFYKNCFFIFNDTKYLRISNKAIDKIKTVTMKNGAVDQCQGDTHGIGIFSQDFNIMPFTQGILLLVIHTEKEHNL